ncbi:pentapeptide repeat-containing protein [Solirubrobacter phytolaccae]|uniref:Pentapeptide repeat-containing protein n=1 Tax=Solirubrobacter phytolaccae TaxID=1404360 RepID=A0A9X3N576_9ACTN|nr:pentapeptide repeat-containing protein [Solirubrobacter phytolaccae]MDA0179948.1 pentapeptide repeat-containing protein [Solirubrobacter phytolaccae]
MRVHLMISLVVAAAAGPFLAVGGALGQTPAPSSTASPAVTAPPTSTAAAGGEDLDRKKLEAEIAKLAEEKEKLSDDHGTLADIARIAPFVTAIVGLCALFGTLWKQIEETGRAKADEVEQRKKDRLQRFDEQFDQMVTQLGSTDPAIRAAATTRVASFLKPDQQEFHEQVFLLLITALRYPRGDVGDKIVARTFQRAAHAQIPVLRGETSDLQLDFSHCSIGRVDLSGLDLRGADIGFADMHGARLVKTNLRRVAGYGVDLSGATLTGADLLEARLLEAKLVRARLTGGANLVSAKLKRADARGAHFLQAQLQEAHFEDADLRGARFEQANLNNAYFEGATFDDSALASIAGGAVHWREARFDATVREKLEQLSSAAKKKGARPH